MAAEVEHIFEERLAAIEATAVRQEAELRDVLGQIRGLLAGVESDQCPRPRFTLVGDEDDG
jgi:hypothetical protein